MVDGVCTKILCNADHVEEQFKNQLSYAVMEERLNDLKEAKAESKKADEKADRIRKLLTNDVDSFNDIHGNEVFRLNFSYGYSGADSLTFETDVNGYRGARYTIASELAVALLPADAKDNIMQIISSIADKFIVDVS